MTQKEMLKKLVPEITDDDIEVLLELSKGVILNARFPNGEIPLNELGETYVENRYLHLQVQMCIEMFNRRGSEGETQRTENGISRTYDTADISKSLVGKILPKCEIL